MFEIGSSVALSVAIGIAFSGIAASTYTLLTNERLKFESAAVDGSLVWSRIALLFLSGPLILLRNSWKAALRNMRPRYWLVLSAVVALSWSFCTGIAIVNALVLVRNLG